MHRSTIFSGLLCLTIFAFSPAALADVFKGFPDVIICKHATFDHTLYVDARLQDGSVRYKTLSGRTITVGSNGVIRRENAPCDGMTIKQLRRQGRTRAFPNR